MNEHYTLGLGGQWGKSAAICMALLSVLLTASVKAEAQNIRYDVKVEKQYFLVEKIPAVFSITNTGPGRVKVKDAAMLKISMELKGPIEDERVEVRKYTYDGHRGVPVVTQPEERADGANLWYAPLFVKKPEVTLLTGESTSMKFDNLLRPFFIEKGVAPGVYTLTIWFDDREKVTKKFRVEVDGERTYERLLQMLRSGDETTMNWASHYLFKIDEKRTLSIIRLMLQSGTESEKNWAWGILHSRGYIKI